MVGLFTPRCLAIAYQIVVEKHHDKITCKSELYHVRLITYDMSLRMEGSETKQSQNHCDYFAPLSLRTPCGNAKSERNDKYLVGYDIRSRNRICVGSADRRYRFTNFSSLS